MRNLLFLLLLTVSGYGQAVFDEGVQITGGQTTTSTTSKIVSQETNGTLNTINAVNFPVSTATTNALELETDVSAGAITGFALTNNGDGTVNIASGTAFLRTTNDPYAQIIKYPISTVTNLALTDNANNFVLVDYNGGSPTITVTTNASTINTQTNSLAYVIARVGNNLEYLNLVGQNVDPNAKLRIRFLNQEGIRRASGAVLGFSNRNLTLTSSVLFSGLIRINAAAFNTATPDTFTLAYNNGSVWTRTTGQTQVNNTEYNVSGTLTTMPNNTFRTDYVYLLPNNPSKLYVIMGNTTYGSLTLAKGAPRPSSLPVELQVLGLEVGRLFIEKNSAAIAEVQSSFANDFIGAAVPEHNSLTGLQGGVSGEYNHLTNAQVALVNAPKTLQYSYDNGSQITTSPSNGAVAIRRGSAADTDNILVGQNGTGTNTFSVTGAGDMTSKNINLSDNPVGSSPSKLRQGMAGNDYWSIYGESSVSDIGRMVFELGDNGTPVSTDGESFEFRYVDTVTPSSNKTVAAIDYNSTILNTPLTVNSNGEINLNGTGGSNSVIKFSGSAIGASTFHLGLGVVGISNSGFSIRDESNTSNRFSISSTGVITNYNLAGSGDRVVSANSNGDYIISAAPTAPTATAGTNTTQIATTAFVQAAVSSGNFTPTAGATVNITSNTPELARWTKVGNVVTVQGSVSTVPTASGGAYISLSLPFSRAASTTKNIGCGTFVAPSSSSYGSAYVQSVSTTESRVYFSAISTNGHNVNYQYTYITTE